jgi:flagellar biogenesis protein FliO
MGAGSEWNAPAINPLGENPTNALPAQNAVVPASGEQVVASMPDAADRASKLDGGHNGSGTPLDISSADPTATKQGSGGVFGALVSIGSSFVIVMALFLGVAWFYRKTVATTMGNSLPKQVVEVLGRSSIAARQQLVLVRFGPKLVLVSMVQGETRMISEITDPVEVDKLTGQCESAKAGSSVQSFKSVFAHGGRAS